MQTSLQKTSFAQKVAQTSAAKRTVRSAVVVRAQKQEVDRRAALGMLAGAAALISAQPSEAAYGQAANVFGGVTNPTGFIPYVDKRGFALLIPSKWNPSKEREFPNVVFRWADNGDDVNNVVVIVEPTSATSIEGFGSTDKFLQDHAYLFGSSVAFSGETKSEGGFLPNKVAATSVLGVGEATDKKGRKYYRYDILSRTADNDEGGRHQLIAATVAEGKLYLAKVQIGDKRWMKGASRDANTLIDSFTVAEAARGS